MQESSEQYELTEAENVVVSRVACNMRAAGLLMVIYGAGLLFVASVAVATAPTAADGWSTLLQSGLFFVLGIWT